MNLYLIAGIAWAASIAASGYVAFGLGQDHEIAKQAKQEKVISEVRQAAMDAAAEAISKIEVKNVTIRQELEREIRTNTVFRDCRSGDAAVRLFNSAIPDAERHQPDKGKLPAANATR